METEQPVKNMSTYIPVGLLLLLIMFLFFSCYGNNSKKEKSNENALQQPQTDTGSLFSIAAIEQIDSGHKVVVTFFESPRIFEFSLGTAQSDENYKLLKWAKEKQVPINVQISTVRGINTIEKVLPASDEQVRHFNEEKSKRQTATPVAKPNG